MKLLQPHAMHKAMHIHNKGTSASFLCPMHTFIKLDLLYIVWYGDQWA